MGLKRAERSIGASACPDCGFGLWLPIQRLGVADVGLYSDSNFPGRCIVSLTKHYSDLESLPEETLEAFWKDVVKVGVAVKTSANAQRINYAVLGNVEAHVHAHVIPRGHTSDPDPTRPPWTFRTRPLTNRLEEDELMVSIRANLARSSHT